MASGISRRLFRPFLVAAMLLTLIGIGSGLMAQPAKAGGGIAVLHVRKNVKDLTKQEKRDIVNAILDLKRTPSPYNPHLSYYDQFVKWHRDSFFCNVNAAHMMPAFPVWHREFLLLFEQALRQVSGNKNLTLPYWDFTDPASTKALFAPDFMGGNGNPNQGWAVTTGPFRKGVWKLNVVDQKANDPYGLTYLVRHFGSMSASPNLPSKADVAQTLARPFYDVPPYNPGSNISLSFRNTLEGWLNRTGMSCGAGNLMDPVQKKGAPRVSVMHNGVHLWVGGQATFPKNPKTPAVYGTMTFNTSDNDPVFWFLHADIDRIYWEWELKHGEVYVPLSGAQYGDNLHDYMWPYRGIGIDVSPAMLQDIRSLGYEYDTELGKSPNPPIFSLEQFRTLHDFTPASVHTISLLCRLARFGFHGSYGNK